MPTDSGKDRYSLMARVDAAAESLHGEVVRDLQEAGMSGMSIDDLRRLENDISTSLPWGSGEKPLVPAAPRLAGAPVRKPVVLHDARYDFVKLGESIAAGMVEAAEKQVQAAQAKRDEIRAEADKFRDRMVESAEAGVTQAQNTLAEAKAFADDLRAGIENKDRELAEMNDRLKLFGTSVKEAHEKFHGRAIAAPIAETPVGPTPPQWQRPASLGARAYQRLTDGQDDDFREVGEGGEHAPAANLTAGQDDHT